MFKLNRSSDVSSARLGTVQTPHGDLATPFFMPIATKGAVKTLSTFDIERLGSPVLLSNTYHLYLRPGTEVVARFGGLHRFMSWDGALLTDSGGYQVFSLAKTRKITEDGATFASHIDGSQHLLTPESSVGIQQVIGSDIVMVLDECTPPDATDDYLKASVDRTTRWARRSKEAFDTGRGTSNNPGAQLFGIVQG
ncbi:tRNA-guanine transglycosylase, partial [Patescibacteria group bacterium]|nr:tRNA-guanine transglycosylase [Patescibacteria group bacterium]